MTSDLPPGTIQASRLRVYPVKGARGVELRSFRLDDLGPRFDRRWMVVTPAGRFVTQREQPRLATIRTSLDGDELLCDRPGTGSIQVPEAPDGPPLPVEVWKSKLDARTLPRDVDEWFSDALGATVRLVYMSDSDVRETDPTYAQGHRLSFTDGYPLLVVGEASVRELARRAARPIPVERFRPNIVVSGSGPHAEDQWRHFSVGSIDMSGVKLCARCAVTTVDQNEGSRDPHSEPLKTLARYRRREQEVFFGINAVHHGPGEIAVGDPVRVHEMGPVPPPR